MIIIITMIIMIIIITMILMIIIIVKPCPQTLSPKTP